MHLLAVSLFCLAPVLAMDPNPLGALLRAQYAHVSGDHGYALELVDAVLRGEDPHPEAAWLKVEILREQLARQLTPAAEDDVALVRELTRFMERYPEDFRFPKAMGVLIVDEPNITGMVVLNDPETYLEKALGLMTDQTPVSERSDTWYYLGRRHYLLGRYFDAFEAFHQVSVLEPELNWALYYAAQAAEASHRLRTAGVFYKRFTVAAEVDGIGLDLPAGRNMDILEAVISEEQAPFERLLAGLAENYDRDETYRTAARLMQADRLDRGLKVLAVVPPDKRGRDYYHMFIQMMKDSHRYEELVTALADPINNNVPADFRPQMVDAAVEAAFLARDFKLVRDMFQRFGKDPVLAVKLELLAAFAALLAEDDLGPWRDFVAGGGPEQLTEGFRRDLNQHSVKTMAVQYLVNAYMSRRDWPAALDVLRSDQYKSANQNLMRDDLAVALVLNGDLDEAFALYDRLLQEHPERKDLLNNYGYFLADAGVHLDKAQRLIEAALKMDPQNSDYQDSLAWVLHKKGEHAAAESVIRPALAAQPKDSEKLNHLGDILFALGRRDEACRVWSQAMEYAESGYLHILNKLDPPK